MLLDRKQCAEFDPYLFSYNYFPTQIFMNQNERPVAYYSLPIIKGDYTPADSEQRIFKWLNFLSNNSPMGNFLVDWMTKLWENKVSKQVKSFSGFILLIEGPLLEFGIRKHKLITHNHPPRNGKNYHNTVTFITPLHIKQTVEQQFNYTDLENINTEYLSQDDLWNKGLNFADSIKQLAQGYVFDEKNYTNWQNFLLPNENQTLEIRFNAARYLHNVDHHKNNIFAAATFNDVEFYKPLNNLGIEYEYYDTIIQPR